MITLEIDCIIFVKVFGKLSPIRYDIVIDPRTFETVALFRGMIHYTYLDPTAYKYVKLHATCPPKLEEVDKLIPTLIAELEYETMWRLNSVLARHFNRNYPY